MKILSAAVEYPYLKGDLADWMEEKGTNEKTHDSIKKKRRKQRRIKHVEAPPPSLRSGGDHVFASYRMVCLASSAVVWKKWKSGRVVVEVLPLSRGRDWPVPQPSEMAGCLICALIRLPPRGANQTTVAAKFRATFTIQRVIRRRFGGR